MARDEGRCKENEGEIVGYIGHREAGKSTNRKNISCMIKPDEGNVLGEGDTRHEKEIGVKTKKG